jgi:hypothetical protein
MPSVPRLARFAIALLPGLLAVVLSCNIDERDEEIPDPSTPEATMSSTPTMAPQTASDRIEELSVLGYLDGTQPARDRVGVTQHDPLRVAPGLNLITSGHGPVALLMDMEGEILHEWRADFSDVFPDHPNIERAQQDRRNFWRDAVLFPNGDLLVIWELLGLFKLDRESRLLWAVREPAHHALQLTDSGEIVHLQAERKAIEGIPEKPAIEDFIVVRDGSGRELRRVAMSDALRNADWPNLRRVFWDRAKPFHTNSLWLLTRAEADRLGDPFRAGDALVSMAMLDTIAVIDMQRGVTLWWQQGPFGMQHEPRPSPDGSLVVFNNFHAADRSSVMSLDPRTRSVVREYTGPDGAPLHSKRSGRVQVLPNGNILVVETDGGRVLELTDDGRIAWEFHSPYRVGRKKDRVASLYSVERVGTAKISWLDVGE